MDARRGACQRSKTDSPQARTVRVRLPEAVPARSRRSNMAKPSLAFGVVELRTDQNKGP